MGEVPTITNFGWGPLAIFGGAPGWRGSRPAPPAGVPRSRSSPQLDITCFRGGIAPRPLKLHRKTKCCLKLYSPGTTVADEFREPPCCLKAFDRESKDHVAVRLRCARGSTTIEEDSLHLWGLFRPGDDDGQLFVCELHGSPYHGSRHGPLSRHRASPCEFDQKSGKQMGGSDEPPFGDVFPCPLAMPVIPFRSPLGQLVMSLSATYIPDGGFPRREVPP